MADHRLLAALPSLRCPAALILGMAGLTLAGCGPTREDFERRIAQLDQIIVEKDHELAAQQTTIKEQQRRIDDMLGLPGPILERVFYPVRLEIERLSGGEDYDGQPGDDGVTVYLRPLDKAGDVVKALGVVRIQLYDLANPAGRNLVGEYDFPAKTVGDEWHGKLWTYHYTLKCPWQHGPPEHPEVTIRAVFQDYLTGHVMSAQTTCTVRPPP